MNLPILLINLSESKGRLENSRQELARFDLSFERLEAVDGRKMSKVELDKVSRWDKSAFFKPLSPGEVGCYLSHIAAAEKIVRENWSYALVLEDDFRLTPNFCDLISVVLKEAPKGFHIIKLQGSVRSGEVAVNLKSNHKIMRHRCISTQTVAQLWSIEGAIAFLSISRPLRRPVDVQLKHWWEGSLNILYLSPPIVIDGDASGATSTIGTRKPKGFLNWLRRLRYKLTFACLSHLNYFQRYGLVSWLRSVRRS
jgi:glycosyl transferase family 25